VNHSNEDWQQILEVSLHPGWDLILREVLERVNGTGQEALNTLRAGVDPDERMHRGGQHQGVRDIYEFLRRLEKDAHTRFTGSNETVRNADEGQ